MEVVDSGAVSRRLVVTFSDHVFTRDAEPSDTSTGIFPGCSRNPGYFCPARYEASLALRELINSFPNQITWMLSGNDRYAQLPLHTDTGQVRLYAIIFTLDRVTGIPFDLHMKIRSAYFCHTKAPDTFGSVKFKHLVRLRCENRHPKKIADRNRPRPRI